MYIVKKKIKGKEYYYLNRAVRQGSKVLSKNVAYLGKDKKEAERKAKEIIDGKISLIKGKKDKKAGIKITYFVHGTTKDNENNISTGQADGELSELGIKQSKELVEQVKSKKFDVVFCSDLKRAVDSAKISFSKYKIIKDKRLRECNYGDLNQAKKEKVVYKQHIDKKFPKGESLKDVEKRIKEFLEFLKENYSGKHIAIVAHKAPQLALEVLTKQKGWRYAINSDWREQGEWQPGWNYEIKEEKKAEPKKQIKKQLSIEDLAVFCKKKGFVYASGEIYGGLGGFWDFGPLGVEMKNNLKEEWWKFHVQQREEMVGIDGSIITNPKVWEASGHVKSFIDVAVICKKCGFKSKVEKHELGKVGCEKCGGEYESKGEFNPMFTTQVGPVKQDSVLSYLRPETAQLMFTNFKLVQENSRMQLPFGIAQIGKAFRNEISPREFLFRSREFEQMEIEYFIEKGMKCPYMNEIRRIKIKVLSEEMQKKDKEPVLMKIYDAWKKGVIKTDWHAYWIAKEFQWFVSLGARAENFRIRQHMSEEKSHYAIDTWDLEYEFPMGWRELQGFANRSDFDLKQHQEHSGKNMQIVDANGKKILPEVVCEPSLGVERAFLVFMFDAYSYDEERENIVLKLSPELAPIKAAVFPIVKKPEYEKMCEKIIKELSEEFRVIYDKSGSIGRRYARNDEAGTPYCVTIDDKSVKQKDVTIRDRDTTKQIRVKINKLKEVLGKLIDGEIEFEKAGKLVETRKKKK